MSRKLRLPPFGKSFSPVPRSGVQVAIGPEAWEFARTRFRTVMALPAGESPDSFKWPSDGGPALIYERGQFDDDQLKAMAAALLKAGAPSVVAIREALLDDHDPRVFFDPEMIESAA